MSNIFPLARVRASKTILFAFTTFTEFIVRFWKRVVYWGIRNGVHEKMWVRSKKAVTKEQK